MDMYVMIEIGLGWFVFHAKRGVVAKGMLWT